MTTRTDLGTSRHPVVHMIVNFDQEYSRMWELILVLKQGFKKMHLNFLKTLKFEL